MRVTRTFTLPILSVRDPTGENWQRKSARDPHRRQDCLRGKLAVGIGRQGLKPLKRYLNWPHCGTPEGVPDEKLEFSYRLFSPAQSMRHTLKCGATDMASLATDKIRAGFPAADNAEAVAFDEHLRGARPRVVVGGGHKSVGSCAPHHKQVTRSEEHT